ncbi:ligand-binding SRPBCC domain-containing protein [Kordia periserrulae]|uniref:Ligand-binding SRPBCC domain-containing protein n=1 Tax=Kordia periserrulae TaxID=701523 RepID=A0A2T6BY75_9FLAO|nr:SRPBCC family protein [Kordia periserrulae]PTX60917.1 ligand-binding SRPBCC domain-containing protein [Kordia periserrulae]
MTTIHLKTTVNAPIETVFDLARNITEHENSTKNTREKAIAGRTSGKINLGETVTWRAKHFGLYLQHTSIISEMESPTFFVDEMVKGVFKSFRHEHIFNETNNQTEMIDKLSYEVPYGIFGRIFNYLVLKSYLTKFLHERNLHLKQRAEL